MTRRAAGTWRATRHHLEVLHLQQVDGPLAGGAVDLVDEIGAVEPARRDAARLHHAARGTGRGGPPGDAAHVDAEALQSGHVAVAVVVGTQHHVGPLRQAGGDGESALLAPVVVGKRHELRDHDHSHVVRSDPIGARRSAWRYISATMSARASMPRP